MIHSAHDTFSPNLSLGNNVYLWKNPSRVLCSPMNTKPNKIKTTKRIFDLQNFISLLDFYGMSGCPPHESTPPPLFIDSYDCVDNWGDFFGSKETGFLLFYMMFGCESKISFYQFGLFLWYEKYLIKFDLNEQWRKSTLNIQINLFVLCCVKNIGLSCIYRCWKEHLSNKAFAKDTVGEIKTLVEYKCLAW